MLGQDFANHGYYTEPNTNITFYTSFQTDGPVVGGGLFTMTSRGGFTFGIALPESAVTDDSYDYIGLLVGRLGTLLTNAPAKYF